MTLIRSSIIFTAAQAALVVVGLASSIVVSRWLGADGRGVFALVTVVTTGATVLMTFGLGTAYTYLAGKGTHPYDQLIGSMISGALALGVITAGALLAFSDLLLDTVLRGMSRRQLIIAVASLPFAYLTYFLANFLIGAGRSVRVAWFQLGAGLFTAGLVVVALVAGDAGVTGVVFVTSLAAAVVASVFLAMTIHAYGVSFRGGRLIGVDSLRYGAKAYVGTLSSQFWLRADFLILNFYSGPTAVGQYSLATSLAEQVWIVDSSVSQVILHDVIKSSPEEAGRLVAKTSRNVVLVAGGTCLALGAAAPWLIPFLFGGEFEDAVVLFWLLFPGVLGIAASRPISSYFFGQLGKPQITSAVSVLTAAVGVAAYFVLVPPLGASGAAIGSSIAYLIPLVVFIPLFGRSTGLTAREMFVVDREDLRMYARVIRRRRQHKQEAEASDAK